MTTLNGWKQVLLQKFYFYIYTNINTTYTKQSYFYEFFPLVPDTGPFYFVDKIFGSIGNQVN